MDAVYTNFKKTLYLLSFTLLFLGPWNSRADAQSITAQCSSIQLTSQTSGQHCTVTSTGAAITFTSSITVTGGDPPNWLGVNPSSGTITSSGLDLFIQVQNTAGLSSTAHTATVNLNATAPAGATGTSIPVTFTPGAGSGGGGSTAITASALQTFCPSGCSNSQYLYLTSTSTTAIQYNITAPSWITLSQSSGTVSNSSQAAILVTVNNFNQAASGQSLTIFFSNTSISVAIPFSGSGGGTGGTVSVNPGSVTWTYSTGGTAPTAQTLSLTDFSGASSWQAYISNISDSQYWLLVQGPGTTASTGTLGSFASGSSTLSIVPTPGNIAALASGTHTAMVTITDSNSNSTTIQITLIINGSGSGGGQLFSNPSTITVPPVAVGSTSTVYTSATITSNLTGILLSPTQAGSCSGLTPALGSTSLTSGSSGVSFTVFGNPTNLSAQTETCYYTLVLSNGATTIATLTIPVSWTIGTGGSGGNGGASNAVLPVSLNFATEAGAGTPLVPQVVTITAAGAWSATVTSTPAGWLLVNGGSTASGTSTGTSTATISVNASGLTAQTYTGSVNFTTPSGSQTVNVTLVNTASSPVIYATSTASFSVQAVSGSIIGQTPQFQVFASDNSALAYTVTTSASWLVLNSSASGTLPTVVYVSIDPSQLANGVYSGSINISAPNAANASLSVPVVLTVTGSSSTGTGSGGTLALSTSTITFNAQVNGSIPSAQTMTASAPSGTSFYVSANGTNNGITWLSVSPSNQYVSGLETITASVNQTGLPIGTYTGSLTFNSTTGSPQSVTVTLNVSSTGGGGNSTISSSPTSLTFSANQNSTLPASQQLSITSSSGSVGFSLNTTEQNGTTTTWLSASANTFTTGATVSVSVNQTGLAAGTYTGAVVITPTGGTALTVPVTLVLAGLPQVTASPSSLNLAYSVGGISPTSSITVTGGASLSYSATVTSNCSCIAVTPNSGDTTSSPTITVSLTNPTSLTAGTYTGTIIVTGLNNATGSTSISVVLTVTAPLPTISAVVNAASGAQGAVSPGEIVSIFGPAANPIGPSTPVGISGSTLVNGNVPVTGLGGVKVTFNGYPAAVIYVSATQINCIVPYEVAGFNGFPVVVTYLGQTSNGFSVQTTTTVPGVFTQNGAGTGPAAILNSDGRTTNGPNAPAPKGSTVSVYMTGEGATTPKGVDGAVTCSAGCSSLSQIPIPLLPVAVLIDGQPAQVVFYGEAPNLVSGLLQVNFVVPAAARSGAVSIVVTVGGNPSQQGATISVQ